MVTVKLFSSKDGLQFETVTIEFKNLKTVHSDIVKYMNKQSKIWLKTYYGYLIEEYKN
jgi:hypothetical protein